MAVWIMNNKKLGDWLKAAGLKKLAHAPGFAFGNDLFEDAKAEVVRQHPEETDPDSRAAYRLLARNKPKPPPAAIVYRPDIPKWLRIGFGVVLLGLLSVLAARSQTVVFKDEGTIRVRRAGGQVGVDFVGAGVSCGTSVAGITTCTITGSGSSTFLLLTDTPGSYAGSGGLCVAVKAAVDGLEFISCGGGGGSQHRIDGVNLTSNDPINFLDTSVFDWTNPAAGDLSLAIKAASLADSLMASSYSGVGGCTNQFARTLNDDAAPTCATVTSTDTSGTFPPDTEALAFIDLSDIATTSGSGTVGLLGTSPTILTSLGIGAAGANNILLQVNATTQIIFEGSVADAAETEFRVTNCTDTGADCLVTFPDADSTTVQPDTGAASNFLTAISATGVISKAQPAFTDISGIATAGQVPNLENLNGTLDSSQLDQTDNYIWTGQHDYDTAEILSAIPLRFEGLTDDNIYTTITITDPAVGRTVTFPDADSNTVQPLTCSGTDKFSAVSALGVFTCDTDQTAGGAFWEAITNSLDTATLYTGDNNAETFTINWTSNWATDRFTVSQGAGNPTAGSLVTISYTDTDIDALTISDGTDILIVNSGMSGVLALFPQGAAEIHATEVLINVEKGSAGTITKGQVVYQSGFDAVDNVIEVELADSDTVGTMPAIGIAQQSITDTTAGHIVAFGSLAGVDTSAFSVGDPLYVSGTPGVLTATKPTGTALIQKVAQVGRSHISLGVIEVFGAGRSNDLPNIANDNIWIGDSSGVPVASVITDCVDTGGNHLNYTQSTNTFACGVSLPSTVVETDQSNTFSTGDQSFAAASSLTVPTAAGAAPTSSGDIRYDSTPQQLEYGDNGVNRVVVNLNEAQTLSLKTLDSSNIIQAGAYDAASIDSDDLATANKTFKCNFVLFDSTGLADTDDINSISNCSRPGRAVTITIVRCEVDAGSPVVNLQRDDGSPANVLSSNLTCSTGGADGSIAAAEDNFAATDGMDFVMVSGASGANRLSMMIEYTVN